MRTEQVYVAGTRIREVPGSNLCRFTSTEFFSKNTIFWDIRLCSQVETGRHSGGADWLHLQGRRTNQASSQQKVEWKQISCLAYFSTLKMEAVCSSKSFIRIYQSTQRYIPEGSTIHSHRCKNLKSNKGFLVFFSFFHCRPTLE
jgi:hypothetical protein